LLRSGRNGGPGIAVNAASAHGAFGLALLKNDLGNGTRLFPTFYHGYPVNNDSIILSYELNGDANLDGYLNADDYARLDQAYAAHTVGGWYYGDFENSGGPPNSDDYFLIDRAFFYYTAPPPSPAAASVIRLTVQKHPRKLSHHRRHTPKSSMFRWQLQ